MACVATTPDVQLFCTCSDNSPVYSLYRDRVSDFQAMTWCVPGIEFGLMWFSRLIN